MRCMMTEVHRTGKAACRSGSGLSEGLGINARRASEMARLREGEPARDAEVQPRVPRMRWPGGTRPLLVHWRRTKRPREASGARVCAAHGDANGGGALQELAIDA